MFVLNFWCMCLFRLFVFDCQYQCCQLTGKMIRTVTSAMSNRTNSTQLPKFSSNGDRCQGNRHAAEAKLGNSELGCTKDGEGMECDAIVYHLMLTCVFCR